MIKPDAGANPADIVKDNLGGYLCQICFVYLKVVNISLSYLAL